MSETQPALRSRFDALGRRWWPAIQAEMTAVTATACQDGSALRRMADYQLATGGKRLRAILPILVADALHADPARVVPFGAACEMLHNASLVHDDLQDGDRVRRGRPSVWAQFGSAQAINLGDGMIAMTVLLLQRLDAPAEARERATRRLLLEMLRVIEGQVLDVALKAEDDISLDDYLAMVEGKTSRLFALPLSGAAMLCGAGDAIEEALVEAACHLGVLFQVQDDILDLYGPETDGPAGGDIREGKLTILTSHCLRTAAPGHASALRSVLTEPRDQTTGEDVAFAAALLRSTGSLDFALDELDRRRDAVAAIAALDGYPDLQDVLAEAAELFLAPLKKAMAREDALARPAAARGARAAALSEPSPLPA